MGQYKNESDAALTLAEECAEVIQIITKLHRFSGNWNEIPPGKDKTRWEQLKDEMQDVLFQWNRLKEQYDKNSTTKRSQAIAWWKNLRAGHQIILMLEYKVVGCTHRNPKDLTGREIEEIWTKETANKIQDSIDLDS